MMKIFDKNSISNNLLELIELIYDTGKIDMCKFAMYNDNNIILLINFDLMIEIINKLRKLYISGKLKKRLYIERDNGQYTVIHKKCSIEFDNGDESYLCNLSIFSRDKNNNYKLVSRGKFDNDERFMKVIEFSIKYIDSFTDIYIKCHN